MSLKQYHEMAIMSCHRCVTVTSDLRILHCCTNSHIITHVKWVTLPPVTMASTGFHPFKESDKCIFCHFNVCGHIFLYLYRNSFLLYFWKMATFCVTDPSCIRIPSNRIWIILFLIILLPTSHDLNIYPHWSSTTE